MCNTHYLRLTRYGRLESIKRVYGSGGFRKDGYKQISIGGIRILEHRYVMEQFLGRKLTSKEVVHHKDRNRQNNDIENLVLTDHSEHRKFHYKDPRKPMSTRARENIRIAMLVEVKNRTRDSRGKFASSRI